MNDTLYILEFPINTKNVSEINLLLGFSLINYCISRYLNQIFSFIFMPGTRSSSGLPLPAFQLPLVLLGHDVVPRKFNNKKSLVPTNYKLVIPFFLSQNMNNVGRYLYNVY